MIFRNLISSLLLLVLATLNTVTAQNTVLVKVKSGSKQVLTQSKERSRQINKVFDTYHVSNIVQAFENSEDGLEHIYRLNYIPSKDRKDIVEVLSTLPNIEWVEKPVTYTICENPNDYDGRQWHLDKIEAARAWGITSGDKEVVVAILDNAIDINHPDLIDKIVINKGEIPGDNIDNDGNNLVDDVRGYDFSDMDNDVTPPANPPYSFGHGTHVAGIAAAATDNAYGIASLGYNISILPFKCAADHSDGKGLNSLETAMFYAVNAGVDVISLSVATNEHSNALLDVIEYAHKRGIVVVAAVGNDNSNEVTYPAAYEHVIGVGASDQNDAKANFSNYGNGMVDVMAPGVSILSTDIFNTEPYSLKSGTSMACPLVASLAALILSHDKSLTPNEVEKKIKIGCKTMIDEDSQGYGSGRINAANSLEAELSFQPVDDSKSITIYPNPANEALTIRLEGTPNTPVNVFIIDQMGRTVKREKFADAQRNVSVKDLPNGIYRVMFATAKGLVRKSLIVQH